MLGLILKFTVPFVSNIKFFGDIKNTKKYRSQFK